MKRLIMVALLCAPITAHAQSSDKEKLDALINANGGFSPAPTESEQPKITNGKKFWDEARRKFGSSKKCIDVEMQKNKNLGITVTVADYDKITSDCNNAGFILGIY